ncbi:MAG: hypothetical protein ACKVTZ_23910, partial [Bacteroidia bacterium]
MYATHFMGADISYKYISGNTYQLKVQYYRNCGDPGGGNASNAPNTATISIKSASCNISTSISVTRQLDQEVSAVCAAQLNNTTCGNGNNSLPGVTRYIYSGNYTLPQNCSDWVFSFQSGNRNNSISTILNPGQDSIYVEAKLNSIAAPGNSSPTFSSLPVPYFCPSQAVSYNHGASDLNGDSLVYAIIDPQHNATTPVTFLTTPIAYSSTYPVATIPANTFNFSTTTGQMSFVPAQIQQGVTAIRVDEYRNGVLIGSVVRDIQLMVINCQGNVAPVISAPSIPTGANVIGPNSYRVCVGSTLQFSITASDANTGTIIGMTSTASANLPGAVFTTTGTNPKTGILTWSPSANDVGNKTFTITITDNACPIP